MFEDIKDLFKTRTLAVHFLIMSLAYLVLPSLIFRVFDSHSNEFRLHGHKWYLNFDGIHYFYNKYNYEPNHAFLPLYVTFVQFVKNALGEPLAIGLLMAVNKLAFLVAAADLNKILGNLAAKESEKGIVRVGLLFFLYNPAGIFFNVVYTESLFCLFSFKAVRWLLERKQTALSVASMAFSVCLRTNGMFLAPVIGFDILSQFFTNLKTKWSLSLKAFLQGISILMLLVAPFLSHNIFTYLNICQWSSHQSELCQDNAMGFYGAVQARYWNVGFLKYFHMGNIVFILIGTPSVIAGALGLLQYSRLFDLRQKGLYFSFVILFVVTAFFTNIQSSTRFFCGHPFFYFILAKLAAKCRLVGIWGVFYWLTGIFMFVVGFPWT